MTRIILGIIVGFVAWSILWIGSDALFSAVSADWGRKSLEFRTAAENKLPYTIENYVLIVLLVKGFIVSVISGFIAVLIAGENSKSIIGLGILLLIFGIFIQMTYWNYMPLWYHVSFLLMLIPMTILGGKLRKV